MLVSKCAYHWSILQLIKKNVSEVHPYFHLFIWLHTLTLQLQIKNEITDLRRGFYIRLIQTYFRTPFTHSCTCYLTPNHMNGASLGIRDSMQWSALIHLFWSGPLLNGPTPGLPLAVLHLRQIMRENTMPLYFCSLRVSGWATSERHRLPGLVFFVYCILRSCIDIHLC